ncbi:FMN-linked oxidoreductase [Collybia nuda]|uniref:FMN-linked oxidoreductase n=1 Tax=Collybia nuda TaxID=64659 RepID=A0A9P5YG21_9AGAR|nr:FMN-linked oxidoreductase [Collybia nuda]
MPIPEYLGHIAAPMVNQSDLPFRALVQKYGASMAYTQMLIPDRLLNDQEYFERHLRDLSLGFDTSIGPTVVQLCGNDSELIVQAGRKLQTYCDGIGAETDLNLGCPQEAARASQFGAYLLGQKDWPLVENIVSSMSHSFTVPVSAKLRLCQPSTGTLDLACRLAACGAAWITLHARTVSSQRRRQGSADLEQVKRLKDHMKIPIISNGNVRVWSDIQENLEYTGADGVMVGETLLGNPCLFANIVPDPVDISIEYLDLCRQYPGTAAIPNIQTHVRHFIEFQCGRRPWFKMFRASLGSTRTIEDIETLLRIRVEKWRGRPPRGRDYDVEDHPGIDDTEKKRMDQEDIDLTLVG